MGIPHEFRGVSAPDFPTFTEYPLDEPRGGGRFELKRGQTTWGTHLSVALAKILKKQRRYDLKEVSRAYLSWVPHAFDVPDSFKPVAALIEDGRWLETVGLRAWLETGQRAAENFGLARAGVIGTFFHHPKHRDARLKATFEDTGLTNFAPICQLASATLNAVIAAAIMTPAEKLDAAELAKVAEVELSYAASTLGREQPDWVQRVKDATEVLRQDLKIAQSSDPQLYGPELYLFLNPTQVRITFRIAFWEAFHAPSFEVGVRDVANRGGDSDTNAAVTGALLGAIFGEKSLPPIWRDRVMEALGPVNESPLWTQYHPRFIAALGGCSPDDPPELDPPPEW